MARAKSAGAPVKPPPRSTAEVFKSLEQLANSSAARTNGSRSAMSEPMCAPTDASVRPAAWRARRTSGSSSSAIPNFEVAAPVARCGWVSAAMPGLIRTPIRPPPAASSASSAPSDSALTSAPVASAAARSASVWPTPLTTIRRGSAPARRASASSTGPTTSKPIPSAASRRRSAGSGLALTAYATSAPGSASRHARARDAARSRSVTYSGVPKRSAASTSSAASVTARRRPSGAATRPRRRGS